MAWLALEAAPGLGGQEGMRTVLILASDDGQSAMESEQIEALRAELPPDTEVVVEYLDAKKIYRRGPNLTFYGSEYFEDNAQRTFSAVVALNDDAIEIATYQRRKGFCESAPMIVCGTRRKPLPKSQKTGTWTGVFCEPDIEKTIEFAMSRHAQTGSVHFLTDHTSSGLASIYRLNEATRNGRFPFSIEVPTKSIEEKLWNLPAMVRYVETLSGDDVVVYRGYFDDWRGGVYPAQVVVPKLSMASKAPIFTVLRDAVGFGAVGGHVINGPATGQAVGKLVRRVLGSESVTSIKPITIEGEWLFDHRQLKRWGIAESALPKGSRIINRPISFWAQNWLSLCVGGSIAAAEAAIIGLLLAAWRRERRAQAALRESEGRMQRLELEISERERQALGHDIHDGLGQYVTALRFQCHRLEQGAGDGRATDADAVGKLVRIASDLATEVRGLARSQVPLQMASRSLEAGLGELAESNWRLFHLETALEMVLDEKRIEEGASAHLYRIAQEATRNAFRHAGATKARIALREAAGGSGELVVENDGDPFEPSPGRRTGLGLSIMEQRARMIGGMVDIGPAEDGKTRLVCRFPLKAEEK